MVGQPDAVIRLIEVIASTVHVATLNGQHHRFAMTLADFDRGRDIGRQVDMLTTLRAQAFLPNGVKKADSRAMIK